MVPGRKSRRELRHRAADHSQEHCLTCHAPSGIMELRRTTRYLRAGQGGCRGRPRRADRAAGTCRPHASHVALPGVPLSRGHLLVLWRRSPGKALSDAAALRLAHPRLRSAGPDQIFADLCLCDDDRRRPHGALDDDADRRAALRHMVPAASNDVTVGSFGFA